jgi:hypothetical protein
MTQDEIIEITRQAGGFDATPKFLEAFANLVVQRTWVGLDEEDYIKALELADFDKVAAFEFFQAKLKDKNT